MNIPAHCNNCSARELSKATIKLIDFGGDYEEFSIFSSISKERVKLKRVELDNLYELLKTIYEN